MFRRLFITHGSILRDLTLASASRDADQVELAIVDAYRMGVTAKFVPPLIELLHGKPGRVSHGKLPRSRGMWLSH